MTQEEVKKKIQDIEVGLHNLIIDGGVMPDTALYAYLNSAEYLMTLAVIHSREYNEEFAKIHINNSNQDQA